MPTLLTQAEHALAIKVLADTPQLDKLTNEEKRQGRQLATKLRKSYNGTYCPGGNLSLIAVKQPAKLDSTYVSRLVAKHPRAGWTQLSRLSLSDGRRYTAGALRYHVQKSLGLDTIAKRIRFSNS